MPTHSSANGEDHHDGGGIGGGRTVVAEPGLVYEPGLFYELLGLLTGIIANSLNWFSQ
jgi:hypothetical protein